MGGNATNKGAQDIQFKYYDPLNSDHFDKRHQSVVPVGIYKGGLAIKINNSSVDILAMDAEISDGIHQARVRTTVDYTLNGLAPATPYIILSWDWIALSAWYMDIKVGAVGDIGANDIVLGKGNYTGSTLNYVEYPIRPVDSSYKAVGKSRFPCTSDKQLRVEALPSPSLDFFANGGHISYGSAYIPVNGRQASTAGIVITAPVTFSRIDLVYVDSGGNIVYEIGGENSNPENTKPSQLNKVPLAEIRLAPGDTQITDSMITDCRATSGAILGSSGGLAANAVLSSFLTMGA